MASVKAERVDRPTETMTDGKLATVPRGYRRSGEVSVSPARYVAHVPGAEPGAVMVIGADDALELGTQAYDKRVVGVVSGAGDLRPGIVLGRQSSRRCRMPIALTGKVFCK